MQPRRIVHLFGPQRRTIHRPIHRLEIHLNANGPPVVRHQLRYIQHLRQPRPRVRQLRNPEPVRKPGLRQLLHRQLRVIPILPLKPPQPLRLPARELGVRMRLHHQLRPPPEKHIIDFLPVNRPIHRLPHQRQRHRLRTVIGRVIRQVIPAKEPHQPNRRRRPRNHLHPHRLRPYLQIPGYLRRVNLLRYQHRQLRRRLPHKEQLQLREIRRLPPMLKPRIPITQILRLRVFLKLIRPRPNRVIRHQLHPGVIGRKVRRQNPTVLIPMPLAPDNRGVVGAHIGGHNRFRLVQMQLHHMTLRPLRHHHILQQIPPSRRPAVKMIQPPLLPHRMRHILGRQLPPALMKLNPLPQPESPHRKISVKRPLRRQHRYRIRVLVKLYQTLEHRQHNRQIPAPGNRIRQIPGRRPPRHLQQRNRRLRRWRRHGRRRHGSRHRRRHRLRPRANRPLSHHRADRRRRSGRFRRGRRLLRRRRCLLLRLRRRSGRFRRSRGRRLLLLLLLRLRRRSRRFRGCRTAGHHRRQRRRQRPINQPAGTDELQPIHHYSSNLLLDDFSSLQLLRFPPPSTPTRPDSSHTSLSTPPIPA